MIHFTSGQMTGWIMMYFWPFVRLLAFVGVAPVLSGRFVSAPTKIGIAAALTFVVTPTLPTIPNIAPFSFPGAWLLMQQIMIGVSLGLVMRVVFAAVQAAGDFVGLQMGLGFASFYSPALGANAMVLSQLLYTFAVLFFLAFNGHLLMLIVLAQSFQTLPISTQPMFAGGWHLVAAYGTTIFASGTILALPLIATLLTINLSLGVLNRASPQLTIFSVGFPMTLLSGLVVMFYMTPEFGQLFGHMFMSGLDTMRQLTRALAS